MMIPISINVRDSAYDKIIYFLSHLKDDVSIVKKDTLKRANEKDTSEEFFQTLRNRKLKVDKNINIDDIMNEMNDGLS